MIARLVHRAVRAPVTIIAITGIAALCAVVLSAKLRFDALPDVTGKQVVVLTHAPGFTPEEVERLVTRPIEMAVAGVPGLTTQRSLSRYGISSVTVVFEEDTELLASRQLIQERLEAVKSDLPDGVAPPELGPLTGGLGEIFQFTLSSPSRPPAELLELVRFRVAPLLASVPGVVEVNSWGGEQRTLDVIADPVRMATRGVTLDGLTRTLEKTSGQVAGARLEAGSRSVLLRGVAWPRSPQDLSSAVLDVKNQTVRVGDVATVVPGAAPRLGAATTDGRGETVYVMVQMLLDANAREVLAGIHSQMKEVAGVLPADIEVNVVYDRGDLVSATLKTVFLNLAEGGTLVIVVLFLTLGSFRAGLLVASVIPLAMLGATVGMVLLDLPGNLMSLGALDFGLLVDGAVVMVEGVFFAVVARGGQVAARAEEAAVSLARPVFYSVLIVLLVYVPILALEGVEGKMFRPMAVTVLLALTCALILSLTYVPAAARLLLRQRDVPTAHPLLVRGLERVYRPVLEIALRRPRTILALGLLALLGGAYLFQKSGTDFVPQLDEGDLVVQVTRDADISIEGAVQRSSALETALLTIPEIQHVASRIGSPQVATDLMGIEQADVFVDVLPRSQWREGLHRADLLAEVESVLATTEPDAEFGITQPIQMRFNELVGGAVTDVSISLFGPGLRASQATAKHIVDTMNQIDGAVDARVMAPPEVDTIEVRPLALESARGGLTPDDVLRHVQALRSGVEVGVTYDGPLRVPLRLRLASPIDARTVERTQLPAADGRLFQLSQVAAIERRSSPALINHDMAERRVVIGFNVRGRDLGSVVEDARRVIAETVTLPEGSRLVWGGQSENLRRAKRRLALVGPAILATIFFLLLVLFRSVRLSALILLNVPFAVVGGICALFVRDMPISVSAAIGFIALSGIAVLNGVVLVTEIVKLRSTGMQLQDAVARGAETRMRPVTMTALVAALGFIPMMLATGVGAEVQRPLATVVVGGLVSSTLLTLVLLPSLFSWLGEAER